MVRAHHRRGSRDFLRAGLSRSECAKARVGDGRVVRRQWHRPRSRCGRMAGAASCHLFERELCGSRGAVRRLSRRRDEWWGTLPVSGVPILVEAEGLRVLVVGGGDVGTRKAKQFAYAGALVRIVSPELTLDLEALVVEKALEVERRPYESGDIANAHIVVAATNDRLVNAAIAHDAEAESRLLNAADHSEEGNFAMMAAHRRGPLTIGV